jgi:hypothetical protein
MSAGVLAAQIALYGLALIMVVWYLAFLLETHQSKRDDRVLYHGSNLREQGALLDQIIATYLGGPKEIVKYALYEPGAGMATVAHYLAGRYAWKEAQAIEIGPAVLLMGKLRFAFWRGKTAVQWKQENLFDSVYTAPALVYCYLFPKLITRLYREGKLAGSLVVSLTFPIEGLEPTEVFTLPSWQGKLLVYDLR